MAMSFQDALTNLINCHSMENGSDTPDFMLAEYLCDCLATYEVMIAKREKWFGREVNGKPSAVGINDLMPLNVPAYDDKI